MSAAAVIALGFGLALMLGVSFLAVTWLGALQTGLPFRVGVPSGGLDDTAVVSTPPEPPLETAPGITASEARARQQARISGYHWVDQQQDRVQIPIERAMDVLAQRGLPARPEPSPGTYLDEGESVPSGASSGREPTARGIR
jgi:hypothetical protein